MPMVKTGFDVQSDIEAAAQGPSAHCEAQNMETKTGDANLTIRK